MSDANKTYVKGFIEETDDRLQTIENNMNYENKQKAFGQVNKYESCTINNYFVQMLLSLKRKIFREVFPDWKTYTKLGLTSYYKLHYYLKEPKISGEAKDLPKGLQQLLDTYDFNLLSLGGYHSRFVEARNNLVHKSEVSIADLLEFAEVELEKDEFDIYSKLLKLNQSLCRRNENVFNP
jgi:hypothetical protein